MICEFCKKRDATLHFASYIQGDTVPKKSDLCEQCLKVLEFVSTQNQAATKSLLRELNIKRPSKRPPRKGEPNPAVQKTRKGKKAR